MLIVDIVEPKYFSLAVTVPDALLPLLDADPERDHALSLIVWEVVALVHSTEEPLYVKVAFNVKVHKTFPLDKQELVLLRRVLLYIDFK